MYLSLTISFCICLCDYGCVFICVYVCVCVIGWRHPGLQFSCGHTGSLHPQPGSCQRVQETWHRCCSRFPSTFTLSHTHNLGLSLWRTLHLLTFNLSPNVQEKSTALFFALLSVKKYFQALRCFQMNNHFSLLSHLNLCCSYQ